MIYKIKKEELYKKASQKAFDNSQILYDESKLLHCSEYYARSFALGITGLEESAKAFLFRAISLNLVDESQTMNYVRKHEKKLQQSGQIILFMAQLMEVFVGLLKIGQEYGYVSTKLAISSNYKKNVELFSSLAREIAQSHNRKLDAFYVDVREGKIINPQDMIDEGQTSALLEIIDMQNTIVRVFINMDDNQFLDVWKSPVAAVSVLKINELLKS